MKFAALLAASLLLLAPGGASASNMPPLDPVETAAQLENASARLAVLTTALDGLARRIEARKAATRGQSLPDGELIDLLQRSQALAGEVAAAHREEEQARTRHRRALEQALRQQESHLRRLRERGGTRTVAVAEEERNRIRRELEALAPRGAAQVALPRTPADDPEEAREQADLLRDQRDRVVAQLALVRTRIDDAREEELLARELRDFVDENELFDESERVMRTGRTVSRKAEERQGGDTNGGFGRDDAEADGFGSGGPALPDPGPAAPAPAPAALRITGSRPLSGTELGTRRIPALDGDESLGELLAQQRALEELAAELDRRAAELEQRARTLAAPPPR